MRILLVPALVVLVAGSAFAKEGHSQWTYRTQPYHGPESYRDHPEPWAHARDRWDHARFEHRHRWAPRRFERFAQEEPVWVPEPPTIRVPPPPPVSIHLWFGF